MEPKCELIHDTNWRKMNCICYFSNEGNETNLNQSINQSRFLHDIYNLVMMINCLANLSPDSHEVFIRKKWACFFPTLLDTPREKCLYSEFFLVCVFLHSDNRQFYFANLLIQYECGKIRARKNSKHRHSLCNDNASKNAIKVSQQWGAFITFFET